MIINLENCNNANKDILNDLKDTQKKLEDSKDILVSFRNNYLGNKDSKDKTYGDRKNKYNISIITEELVDEGVNIKRRYGIAIDKNMNMVVQSTPTFASDDSIIINEVKVLLVSKGFVNSDLINLSSQDIAIVNESLNFLDGGEISEIDFYSLENLSFENNVEYDIDSADNENEDIGIGLNAFVNKLPGGKKLRKRVKKKMQEAIKKTKDELKNNNP